jgi:putative transposase
MNKFKNKYRIASHRRPHWDYSADALYFLTLVTQHRVCNLGYIDQEQMFLSDFGKIISAEWLESFKIRKELILHEYVIMPNHLHAIVEIDNGTSKNGIGMPNNGILMPNNGIGPSNNPSDFDFDEIRQIKRNPPVRLPKSISSFIGGYKSVINTKIDDFIDEHQLRIPKYNRNNHFFQPNYHDHIIRNDTEYHGIAGYIRNNVRNWNRDKFNQFRVRG